MLAKVLYNINPGTNAFMREAHAKMHAEAMISQLLAGPAFVTLL
jgi:hypothetical protein